MIRLWSINRWLRWLGFVLVVECDGKLADDPERRPTRVGVVFTGWPPDRNWALYVEKVRRSAGGG